MPEQIVHYDEIRYNNMSEATIAASSVTANYQSLLDLGTSEAVYKARGTKTALSIENTLNQNIILAFAGVSATSTKTIAANTSYSFDKFPHWGNILIKAQSSLPTAGSLIISSW